MNSKLRMILTLICTGIFSAIMIQTVVIYTRPYVERNRQCHIEQAVLAGFGIPFDKDNLHSQFNNTITENQYPEGSIFRAPAIYPDKTAYLVQGPGFWDTVQALVVVDDSAATIITMRIVSHNETPGLGARIADNDFLRQFTGKIITRKIAVQTGNGDRANAVDAVSGATQSSKALVKILNTTIPELLKK